MNKAIEIKLANGYTVVIYNDEGVVLVELVNPNDHAVSDVKLSQEELSRIDEVVNSK